MKRLVLLIFSLLVFLLACGNQPDVEATIAAGISMTQTSEPTDTPIPSATPLPTETATPVPTDTPEPTPTPAPTETAVSTTTASLTETEQDDGTILYELPNEGYAIALPEEWEVVDLSEGFFSEIFDALAEQNESLPSVWTNETFQSLVAAGIKFYAINFKDESVSNLVPATISVVKEELNIDIDLVQYSDLAVNQLELLLPLSTDITQEATRLGEYRSIKLSYELELNNPIGVPSTSVNNQYIILEGNTAYIVTVGMGVELADDLLPTANEAVQFSRLLTPAR